MKQGVVMEESKQKDGILSKRELRQHIWLVQGIRQAKHTSELEALGFNYFSRNREHKHLAWKLIKIA